MYVAGQTLSDNFPNTNGGAQGTCTGCSSGFSDAFVARLNSDLTSNLQSTYLGGGDFDDAFALAIGPGPTYDVYVAGRTLSADFPNTAGGAKETCEDCSSDFGFWDGFVARLSSDLTSNPQSTYLGGSNSDEALALAVHPSTGDVYVAGRTTSTDFPNTTGGAQPNYGGGRDAFVARLNSTLTSNPQSTYLGGTSDDWANALAIAPSGDVYVAGSTTSTNFPKTSGGAQENYGGGTFDAFVARLTADLAASFTLSISPTPTGGNVTSSPAGINCGSSGSTCSASFPSGITVTLMATPDTGYIFVGWGGDPDCADGSVTMNGDKTCTATFQLQMGLLWGDVDCDGDVDAVDALKVLRHVVRLAVSQEEPCPDIGSTVTVDGTPRLWGDVDGYGDVDAVDALQILRHVVRLWVAQRPGTPPIGSRVHVVLPG